MPTIINDLEKPICAQNRIIRIGKSYTDKDFKKQTVLTDDIFTYVSFFYQSHKKAMKFVNPNNRVKYGNPSKYSYEFYWKQAEMFYKAAKTMPIEVKPVASYYCMLNAAKSYIAFTSSSADVFVENFGTHGISEDKSSAGNDLANICITHKQKGVFPLFASKLDPDFTTVWAYAKNGTNYSYSIKTLMYNLPFIHRAYVMTYSKRYNKVEELFVPVRVNESPMYFKANDGKAYMSFELERSSFSANAQSITNSIKMAVNRDFSIYMGTGFRLISNRGARWNSNGSISKEIKDLTNDLRKDFVYIRSPKRLWYLKKFHILHHQRSHL